jgi:hypothetical protein
MKKQKTKIQKLIAESVKDAIKTVLKESDENNNLLYDKAISYLENFYIPYAKNLDKNFPEGAKYAGNSLELLDLDTAIALTNGDWQVAESTLKSFIDKAAKEYQPPNLTGHNDHFSMAIRNAFSYNQSVLQSLKKYDLELPKIPAKEFVDIVKRHFEQDYSEQSKSQDLGHLIRLRLGMEQPVIKTDNKKRMMEVIEKYRKYLG